MQWWQGMMDGDAGSQGERAVPVDIGEAPDGPQSIGSLIKVANTLIERELNNRVAALLPDLGLTGPQVTLLVYLYDSKGRTVTQREVADRFVLSHPTIRGIVRRLEKAGLVDLSQLGSDRRQIVLSLSGKGFDTVDRHIDDIRMVMEDVNSRIVGDMDADEIHRFMHELNRIIRAF